LNAAAAQLAAATKSATAELVRAKRAAPPSPRRAARRLDEGRETEFVHQRAGAEFLAQHSSDFGAARPSAVWPAAFWANGTKDTAG
jgi:hypothetical protein